MRETIFRQYDHRWSNLPYPTSRYTFGLNGCGCCAVTHLVIEQPRYSGYTPANVRKYMVQFATQGNGTLWDGITKGLKHYGYDNVYIPANMESAWKQLDKGNRIGILLMDKGTRGGVTWTSGGHYIAFLDYKVINGRHYFYIKDSGGRKNDGWFCYETKMKGLIKRMWIVEKPHPKIIRRKYYDVWRECEVVRPVNLRTGAGPRYKRIRTLQPGYKFICRGTSKNGRYVKIDDYRWACGRGKTKVYIVQEGRK